MALAQGTVKSVLSGDTVVLSNPKGLERTLSLAYVSAPRMKRDADEVCRTVSLTFSSTKFDSHFRSSHVSSFESC